VRWKGHRKPGPAPLWIRFRQEEGERRYDADRLPFGKWMGKGAHRRALEPDVDPIDRLALVGEIGPGPEPEQIPRQGILSLELARAVQGAEIEGGLETTPGREFPDGKGQHIPKPVIDTGEKDLDPHR